MCMDDNKGNCDDISDFFRGACVLLLHKLIGSSFTTTKEIKKAFV